MDSLSHELDPRRLARVVLAACVLSGLSVACQKKEAPPPTPPPAVAAAPAAVKPPPAPPAPAVKKLEWSDPKEWKRVKPSSPIRQASYEIPAAKGDKVPGELNVFILGGAIEPNIQRWLSEFSGFDVKSVVRSDRTVNDLTQAIVELPKGKFSGGMGSTPASENFGLLGAIIVMPSGVEYFFKLTGPSATVKAARKPFYDMLDSMHVEGATPGSTAPATPGAAPATPGAAPAAPGAAPAVSTTKPAAIEIPATTTQPTPAEAAAHKK